jgi:hypothetical protein
MITRIDSLKGEVHHTVERVIRLEDHAAEHTGFRRSASSASHS